MRSAFDFGPYRRSTVAPASEKAVSGIEALRPAPDTTATLAPNPINFLTVSGVAEMRLSLGAVSRRTVIFIDAPVEACLRTEGCSDAARVVRSLGALDARAAVDDDGLAGDVLAGP